MHQNAETILIARRRAERDLELARQALEIRTAELATSLALTKATLESTADGILATDHGGRITGYNEKFVQMWRIPRDVIATGECGGLFHWMSGQMPNDVRFLEDVETIVTEGPAETFDMLELADGRVFERNTRSQRIEDRVIGRVWSYRDVTERARAEAALRDAKAQAETANRTKSAFLAMMSHELRTPLNAIAGYAELMQLGIHGPVTDEQAHALGRIQASQRHLLGLIDEVLTHAKLETGNVHYELTSVNAGEAIAKAEELLAPQAWIKGVTITTASCPADVRLLGDAEKVQQILVNLLSNAVKFTTRGGRIEIECSVAQSTARITICDTGVGIAAEMLDRIFEPFVQVRSELTRSADGTGLGLAISRALARGMGGDVTVSSTVGRGSSFTLVLPAA